VSIVWLVTVTFPPLTSQVIIAIIRIVICRDVHIWFNNPFRPEWYQLLFHMDVALSKTNWVIIYLFSSSLNNLPNSVPLELWSHLVFHFKINNSFKIPSLNSASASCSSHRPEFFMPIVMLQWCTPKMSSDDYICLVLCIYISLSGTIYPLTFLITLFMFGVGLLLNISLSVCC